MNLHVIWLAASPRGPLCLSAQNRKLSWSQGPCRGPSLRICLNTWLGPAQYTLGQTTWKKFRGFFQATFHFMNSKTKPKKYLKKFWNTIFGHFCLVCSALAWPVSEGLQAGFQSLREGNVKVGKTHHRPNSIRGVALLLLCVASRHLSIITIFPEL